jgi:hypothetical protein
LSSVAGPHRTRRRAAAFSPDDRALYRGSSADPAPASQSPDDRPFYCGGSESLAPASVSPADRPFLRNVTEIDPASPPVAGISSATGFDWEDAALGSSFGVALALLAA